MAYNIDKQGSILGSAVYGYRQIWPVQSAIVMIKNSAGKYRVFLGCAGSPDEDSIYQQVAGLGDELPFEYIEYLYKTLKEQRNENN